MEPLIRLYDSKNKNCTGSHMFFPSNENDRLLLQTIGQFNQPRFFVLFVCFLKIQHFLGCPDQIGMMYPATP